MATKKRAQARKKNGRFAGKNRGRLRDPRTVPREKRDQDVAKYPGVVSPEAEVEHLRLSQRWLLRQRAQLMFRNRIAAVQLVLTELDASEGSAGVNHEFAFLKVLHDRVRHLERDIERRLFELREDYPHLVGSVAGGAMTHGGGA
jgi:hypothetical protein